MGMLMPIHCICMEFYLRTGFRESQTYVGGKEHKKSREGVKVMERHPPPDNRVVH